MLRIAVVVVEEVREASQVAVLISLPFVAGRVPQRCTGVAGCGDVAGIGAKPRFDECRSLLCTAQPDAVACRSVQRQEGTPHRQRIAEVRAAGVRSRSDAVLKAAAGPMQMRQYPLRRRARLGERMRIACALGERRQCLDGPAVLTRVKVRVDAWNAFRAALRIGEREVLASMLALHEISVL